MSAIPERFAATGADAAVSITRAVTLHRIGLRLDFDGRLDADRLARAVRLSLDAEPVVGCALRTDGFKAYWERMKDLDGAHAFSATDSRDVDADVVGFQAREVDDAGPQARVQLFRTPVSDVLGIKISHVLGDGQAAKQYAYLLADIYSRLSADGDFAPQPNLAPRASGRDVWAHLTREQRREAGTAKSWANPTWDIPSTGDGGRLTYSTATIGPADLAALKAFGKQHGATVNDVMLTATFRACVREFDPPAGVPQALMCTADLRRFLPDPEKLPISNVSISGSMDIERVDGEEFARTLERVRERMAAWARTCYGAGPAAGAERLAVLGYGVTKALLNATFRMAGRTSKSYPWFTNMGVLDEGRLSFDGLTPVAGHMFGPAAMTASIVPAISTYRDTLTVCMGFRESDADAAMVRRVLDSIVAELRDSGCMAVA